MFTNLQNKTVAELLEDAFFTKDNNIPVIADNNPIAIASGEILLDRIYEVSYGSVTYNGEVYSEGELFTGVADVTTFTGDGSVFEDRTARQLQRALSTIGICVVVMAVDDISPDETGGITVPVEVQIYENTELNRKTSGTARTGLDVGLKAWAILAEFEPETYWDPFIPQGLNRGTSSGAIDRWVLRLKTGTAVNKVSEFYANESGIVFVNEEGQPLLATPTNP